MGGFIVHFFSREKVEYLSKGYRIITVEDFEGGLPRKFFFVVLKRMKRGLKISVEEQIDTFGQHGKWEGYDGSVRK